ncbi:Cerato-platanin [Stachybotrys elegans]|uniref:Cerato-platanin n=1 Tax=Stachybotrys elegans TaxID=80388 RepID=A0A8K0SGX3_9HYPO|nr:Cerato-platanin [Stachybotrys elegans]
MKLCNIIAAMAFLVSPAVAATLRHDASYNFATNLPLTSFACSDGANGLITKYRVQNVAQLRQRLRPNIYIAASPSIPGWNSPQCGSCFKARNPQNNKSITFVGVDTSRNTGNVVTGGDAFRNLSPSGSLAEGHLTVYITTLPTRDCFR